MNIFGLPDKTAMNLSEALFILTIILICAAIGTFIYDERINK